ncbi:Prolyl 4-hydroxylase subunit alpha-1 [Chlorella sorokiniana]|uniref:procollagen-proline 4-dioxygenase n=1 Tax=Chlorella sorokiniana TaxID=3076 RepID=A0A2P6TQ50_CHLSO|nr:Prolyl 4-hydroxylase subunit alpha-1 [Chlorella sorokiniana]|eukprot:PRW56157.1 Prolyl 4-hydroxylase subunit alpha-1 [Chlorella sorokiniana]
MRTTCLLPALLAALLLAGPALATDDDTARRVLQAVQKRAASLSASGDSKAPWVEPVSWRPRAFVFHNFMTEEEADHIVKAAKPFMKRSTVVGPGGASVEDSIRTSYGTFLKRLQDPVIAEVENRVATWTQLNITHQEDMQILRYGIGQKYGAHYDSLDNDSPRVATVLLYLSDVEEGGETAFPQGSEWIDSSVQQRFEPFSECAAGHVAAKPKKGDALLFFSLKPDGKLDAASMHTGCPVVKGVKWTATKWIHTLPFRPNLMGKEPAEQIVYPEECKDARPECADWAAAGECEKNKAYMRGDMSTLGACRAACGDCEICAKADRDCMSRNRVRAGYLSMEELDM